MFRQEGAKLPHSHLRSESDDFIDCLNVRIRVKGGQTYENYLILAFDIICKDFFLISSKFKKQNQKNMFSYLVGFFFFQPPYTYVCLSPNIEYIDTLFIYALKIIIIFVFVFFLFFVFICIVSGTFCVACWLDMLCECDQLLTALRFKIE